jgi:hypothetical protein
MRLPRRAVALALLLAVGGVAPSFAQSPATTTLPVLKSDEMVDFLLRGPMVYILGFVL